MIRRKFSRSSMRLWDRASRVSDWMSGGGTPRRPDDKAMEHQAGYDAEFREELAGQAGVGMRVWYDTFTSIDWLHDAVKEDWRRKRLQGKKGIRGKAALAWDRSQGWVIVTLIGLITALAAGAIVNMEMWLFDLKEGERSIRLEAAPSDPINRVLHDKLEGGQAILLQASDADTRLGHVASTLQHHPFDPSRIGLRFALIHWCLVGFEPSHILESEGGALLGLADMV